MAVQPSENFRDHFRLLADGEIAEVPDFIVRSDRLVPPLHKPLVHCSDRGKRPPVKPQSAAMTEMRVADKERSHSPAQRGWVKAADIPQQCSCRIYDP